MEGYRNKEEYIAHIEGRSDYPVFAQPWFLNAVCEEWDAVCVKKKNGIMGTLAYPIISKGGQKGIANVPMLPYLFLWIDLPHDMKFPSRRGKEIDVVETILDALPSVGRFNVKFYQNTENWLPFYWRGFSQTTHFTNVLESSTHSIENLRADYKESVRRTLKKANDQITVSKEGKVETLVELGRKSFARQGKDYPNSDDSVKRLFDAVIQQGRGKLYIAEDENHQVHSTALIVEDNSMMYYLIGGSDPDFHGSGAMNLLLDTAIMEAAEKGLDFNFEGSMVKGIDRFFASFGATQVPVSKIEKDFSLPFKLRTALKALKK